MAEVRRTGPASHLACRRQPEWDEAAIDRWKTTTHAPQPADGQVL